MPRPRKVLSNEEAHKIAEQIMEYRRQNALLHYNQKKNDEEYMEKRRAYYREYQKEAYQKDGKEKKREYYLRKKAEKMALKDSQ